MSSSGSKHASPQPLVDDFEQPPEPHLTPTQGLLVFEQLVLMMMALDPEALRCSREPIPADDFLL